MKSAVIKSALIFSLLCIISSHIAQAQSLRHLWSGLRSRQEAGTLPVSRAQTTRTEKKAFVPTMRLFTKDALRGDKENWLLRNWALTDNNTLILSGLNIFDPDFEQKIIDSPYADRIFNATVPGTVLGTLTDNGVYPDPYYGLNNMLIPDSLSRTDWWYRCTFFVAPLKKGEYIFLDFGGINYKADIYLNGHRIASSAGAFRRTGINISEYLSKDTQQNILAVHVYPPANPGIPHEQSMTAGQGLNGGALSMDGPTFISSVGWDWMPGIRDRNTGIWQDVTAKKYHDIRLGDIQIISDLNLPDTSQADLYINIHVENLNSEACEFSLGISIRPENGYSSRQTINLERKIRLEAGESRVIHFNPQTDSRLRLRNPSLWWPNGYGEASLYALAASTESPAGVTEYMPVSFGIRELSYELSTDSTCRRIEFSPTDRISRSIAEGRMEFSFQPVFDNEKRHIWNNPDTNAYTRKFYLPTLLQEESIKDTDKDQTSPYLILKVNGKRIFCRGGNWGMDDAMKRHDDKALENAIALHAHAGFNIIRNWTGESTQENFYSLCDKYGMLVWNDFWITTDDTVEPLDHDLFLENARDVIIRYRNHPSIAVWCPRNEGFAPEGLEKPLNAMVNGLDPTRHYHGQSRLLNMGTSGPWGYFDEEWYFSRRAEGFNTEMGSYAIPTAATIRKFIAPEDLWPVNDVWAYHDLHHTTQNFQDFMKAVNSLGIPESMEEFSSKAQLICYDSWRAMIEAWNDRIWDNTTGLILWMSHPAWPSMIWQTYTYDFETPGSYFGARKASEMIHVQWNPVSGTVSVIDTDTRMDGRYKVTAEILDSDGRLVRKYEHQLESVPGRYKYDCMDIPSDIFSQTRDGKDGKDDKLPRKARMLRLELTKKGKCPEGNTVSLNEYWDYAGECIIPGANLWIICTKGPEKGLFTVSNTSDKVISGIKLNAVDPSGEIILPAFISDSYFTLLPGESRKIRCDESDMICTEAVYHKREK